MKPKKRVVNPQRYLHALKQGDEFYITVRLEDGDYAVLEKYGIWNDRLARIPIPHYSATNANTNGNWKVRKDLPKESRLIEHDYHVVDWHGMDHYGTCWQNRLCYQREFIPPQEISFGIDEGVLYSPLMVNDKKDFEKIKTAMNVVLEMLGRFEIWDSTRLPAISQIKVPWEILRPGAKLKSDWEEHVKKIIERKSNAQQAIVFRRHEYLWKMSPDFCVIGTQNFWGYIVYGFTALNLFIFESNELNNATYVFKGNWEMASRLTKVEVLSGKLQDARLYHTSKWYDKISVLLRRVEAGS